MRILLILFLSCIFYAALAQTGTARYKLIDSKVKSIQSGNIDTLAKKITASWRTDTEKVRAIFRWVTENIEYDTELYHDTTGIYKSIWQESLGSGHPNTTEDYNNRIVTRTLTTKKAVCDGYSRLFKTLCDKANINCEIITGYIHWSSDPIGEITNRTHAWNAVYIDGAWKLIDATWASGYSDFAVTKFTKSYNDFFFFTDPVEFFNDHYPDDPKWSLLPNTPSRYDFYNFPFYYPHFYRSKISFLSPTSGFIEISRQNKTARIELDINVPIKDFFAYEIPSIPVNNVTSAILDTLNEDVDFTPEQPKYIIRNRRLSYNHEFKTENPQTLHLVLNGKLILSYGVRISDHRFSPISP